VGKPETLPLERCPLRAYPGLASVLLENIRLG
jgi:hypothetical protein